MQAGDAGQIFTPYRPWKTGLLLLEVSPTLNDRSFTPQFYSVYLNATSGTPFYPILRTHIPSKLWLRCMFPTAIIGYNVTPGTQ